jgi:hypothetical protein
MLKILSGTQSGNQQSKSWVQRRPDFGADAKSGEPRAKSSFNSTSNYYVVVGRLARSIIMLKFVDAGALGLSVCPL